MTSADGQGNNTMKWVLPTDPDPTDYVCYVVKVPNSYYHITAFLGSIYDLSLWWNWERDTAKTARVAAYAWRRVWVNLKQSPCDLVSASSIGIPVKEPELNDLRIVCVNGKRKLQFLKECCPEVWIDILFLGDAAPPGQPGGGDSPTPPAAGGGTQQYCYQLQANQTLLIPTGVTTGDVIQLQSANGAGWDGTETFLGGPLYRCFDGQQFLLGQCVANTTTSGGDPLPATNHMQIIAQINGSYYPFVSGSLTVPGGITNGQLLLQVNDATLTDNAGTYNVCVQVTNNQATSWVIDQDLTTTPGLYTSFGTDPAFWSPGVGWVYNTYVSAQAFGLHYSIPATTFTRAYMDVLLSGPINPAGTFAIPTGAASWPGLSGVVRCELSVNTPGLTVIDLGGNGIETNLGASCTVLRVHYEGIGTIPPF